MTLPTTPLSNFPMQSEVLQNNRFTQPWIVFLQRLYTRVGTSDAPSNTELANAIQDNIVGPALSVDGDVPVFTGTTGKILRDSGVPLISLAPLLSPNFTGAPTAPTPTVGDNSSLLATTAFVTAATINTVTGPASSTNNDIALFNGTTGKIIKDSGTTLASLAPLASPTFTGDPKAPTALPGDNDTSIATTAFVQAAITALSANSASFSTHNNGVAQSIPNNAFTKLTFSTNAYSTGSFLSGSRWTPPAGRPILLVAGVNMLLSGPFTIAIFKNGAEYKRGTMISPTAAATESVEVTCMDIPNGTDFYEAFAFQNSSAAVNTNGLSNLTFFQGTTIQA